MKYIKEFNNDAKFIQEFSLKNMGRKAVKFGLFFNISCDKENESANAYLYAIAKSSKELDKLEGKDKLEISDKIKEVIELKGLEVSWQPNHPGAGYWFKILPHSLHELIGLKNIEINV